MSDAPWPLTPRAARVYYNVADAWLPEEAGTGIDAVAALAPRLAGARARSRLARRLWLLEWSPRIALRSRSGFSWLSRAERRAWLARLASARSKRVRDAVAELERLVRPPR